MHALPALAIDIGDVVSILGNIYGINIDQLDEMESLHKLNDKTLQQLQEQQKLLIGSYGYGGLTLSSNAYSWGKNNDQLSSLLNAYQNGHGDFGSLAKQLHQQFPINPSTLKPHDRINSYNQLQAETTLTARTASEYSYNQIEEKLEVQRNLQKQIDRAPNIKAAIDLQNRLSYENNLLQLELLRLISVSTQQQAVAQQDNANSALIRQRFFDLKTK